MRFYEVIKTILGLVVVPAYPGVVVLRVKYKQTCFYKLYFCVISFNAF